MLSTIDGRLPAALLKRLAAGLASGLDAFPVVASNVWARFNTVRSLSVIVWAIVTMAFLTPSHAEPAHATTAHVHHSHQPAGQSLISIDSLQHNPTRCQLSPELSDSLSACWGATRIEVPAGLQMAWDLRPTLVAVLDTGINDEIPCLRGRIVDRAVLVDGAGQGDIHGHGTHIAATIATIAPNARLFDVKVANDRGLCTSDTVALGVRLAVDRGAAVINLSLEVESSAELKTAVEYGWRHGAVIIAAAGMPSYQEKTVTMTGCRGDWPKGPCRPPMSDPVYPAAYQQVIAVTGTNELDELAPISNRATWVDVAAPGHRTYVKMPAGLESSMTGTSTAAAHVTGVAALLRGLADDRNDNGRVNDEVRQALEATAEPLHIEGTGYGIVNARAAVAALLLPQRYPV